jgi:hypothetical protein
MTKGGDGVSHRDVRIIGIEETRPDVRQYVLALIALARQLRAEALNGAAEVEDD